MDPFKYLMSKLGYISLTSYQNELELSAKHITSLQDDLIERSNQLSLNKAQVNSLARELDDARLLIKQHVGELNVQSSTIRALHADNSNITNTLLRARKLAENQVNVITHQKSLIAELNRQLARYKVS